jgi:hypothetical protein
LAKFLRLGLATHSTTNAHPEITHQHFISEVLAFSPTDPCVSRFNQDDQSIFPIDDETCNSNELPWKAKQLETSPPSSLCHMLQLTFSRLLRSGSGDKARQSKAGLPGGQDKGRKAQHRKFPMNLGGIFWICPVLFRRELQTVSS